jgi:hypothetical protein
MVVGLTAARFKPLISRIPGFFLSNTKYIWIYIITSLLLPVSCIIYLFIRVRNFDSHLQFADWCAPVKISSSAELSVLQVLQFQEASVRRVLPGGTGTSHN